MDKVESSTQVESSKQLDVLKETNLLKQRVCQAIDDHREDIVALGEQIFANPELGYKEYETAALVKEQFEKLNLEYQDGIALTGLRADLAGKESKVRIAIMGELDAVVCPQHPQAHPDTGAAHSCGHNGQIAGMLGVAYGLVKSGVMQELSGDIAFIATPAEEYVELDYRKKLIEEGKVRFFGGKQEMIALGVLDDIDITMMYHVISAPGQTKATIGGTSNGFVGKLVEYQGREAHAGGAPHLGINALNAASLGIMGVHAQRETFKDEDHIRFHPIITKGGDLVNIVPADVTMEAYVRGASMDGILDASQKVNRALRAGAYAIGADVTINELPGYLPRFNEPIMTRLFGANLGSLIGEEWVTDTGHMSSSSDIGDIMHLMPAIHPYVGGGTGNMHSKDFAISDPELAYISGAKALAMTVIDLLVNAAADAQQIVANYQPRYDKESYLKMWEQAFSSK